MKNKKIFLYLFLAGPFWFSCKPEIDQDQDILHYALSRKNDLKLSVYFTAQAIDQLWSGEATKREALSMLRANGITSVYLEVYRSGLVVPNTRLDSVIHFFKTKGFSVAGGIATVPGGNFGLKQEGKFQWFNWQNEKTQKDLSNLMEKVAPLFDAFIVDDFICTADTSVESQTAKGDRSWPEYRRDLLTDFSEKYIIAPAKKANPGIRMIIKYPQWYDRYPLFGYDVSRQTALYDQVWIGTESRGPYTPRFGYVQPYEGFVNYRWMSSVSGDKMGGAWFDHIDCDQNDFIEQAYQAVLAGAKELILFNSYNIMEGHPGQHFLRSEFNHLADLAALLSKTPVDGISTYKPPNSDPGGDMYIYDFIGMFGVPLIPYAHYPSHAEIIFLPTQAAADSTIFEKIKKSMAGGARIVLTTGFLNRLSQGQELAELAGVQWPIDTPVIHTPEILVNGKPDTLDLALSLEGNIKPVDATVELTAVFIKQEIPFLCRNAKGNIYILNVHTFSDEDFKSTGEELLCPKPLGLMEVPLAWANTLRKAFNGNEVIPMDGPARVSYQPFGDGEFLVQNYNQKLSQVKFNSLTGSYVNVLTGDSLSTNIEGLILNMAPRSRYWIREVGGGR